MRCAILQKAYVSHLTPPWIVASGINSTSSRTSLRHLYICCMIMYILCVLARGCNARGSSGALQRLIEPIRIWSATGAPHSACRRGAIPAGGGNAVCRHDCARREFGVGQVQHCVDDLLSYQSCRQGRRPRTNRAFPPACDDVLMMGDATALTFTFCAASSMASERAAQWIPPKKDVPTRIALPGGHYSTGSRKCYLGAPSAATRQREWRRTDRQESHGQCCDCQLRHGIAPFPSEAAPAASRTSAAATPAPYSGSAFAQLWMWCCWISCDAPPTWRAVFSKSTWRWAGFIFRNRSPGCW